MNFKPLKIGNLTSKLPIIQGGMGIGVSLSSLASAVTKAGGIGVISGAHAGYREDDFETNTLEANLRGLKKHIKLAKEKCNNGIIGVNLMVAMNDYKAHVEAAIEAGVDIIISGAGIPLSLPKYTEGSSVKLAPIVSSVKAAKLIFNAWMKRYNASPDLIIVEGPKAGGHLGFHADKLQEEIDTFEDTVVDIVKETKKFGNEIDKEIPVIIAGGIFDGNDIAKYLTLGADGVQMATRFVATEECDASLEYKNAYISANKDDITIVKSPVGMPGRAINNTFVKGTKDHQEKISKCYNCLVPCKPANTPYCISKALINAVKGNLENGLIFCGENAYKLKEISTVQKIMDSLEKDLSLA